MRIQKYIIQNGMIKAIGIESVNSLGDISVETGEKELNRLSKEELIGILSRSDEPIEILVPDTSKTTIVDYWSSDLTLGRKDKIGQVITKDGKIHSSILESTGKAIFDFVSSRGEVSSQEIRTNVHKENDELYNPSVIREYLRFMKIRAESGRAGLIYNKHTKKWMVSRAQQLSSAEQEALDNE